MFRIYAQNARRFIGGSYGSLEAAKLAAVKSNVSVTVQFSGMAVWRWSPQFGGAQA